MSVPFGLGGFLVCISKKDTIPQCPGAYGRNLYTWLRSVLLLWYASLYWQFFLEVRQ